jgi:predicted transcriptional regulator
MTDDKPYRLSDKEREAVRRGLAEMREGKLASDEAVAAVFNRYRSPQPD